MASTCLGGLELGGSRVSRTGWECSLGFRIHSMKTLQQILVCAFLAALTALVVCAILLLRAATATVAAIPGEIEATRQELIGVVEAVRNDLTAQVESTRQDVLTRAERQSAALRADVMTEVAEIRKMADRRLGDTLARAIRPLALWKRSGGTSIRSSTIPPRSPRR